MEDTFASVAEAVAHFSCKGFVDVGYRGEDTRIMRKGADEASALYVDIVHRGLLDVVAYEY